MTILSSFKIGFLLVVVLLLPFGKSTNPLPEVKPDGVSKLATTIFSPQVTSLLGTVGSLLGFGPSQIEGYLNLARTGLGLVETLQTIFLKVFNGTSINFNLPNSWVSDEKLLAVYELVDLRLHQIERGIEGTQSSLRTLVKGLPHLVRWEIAMDTLDGYMLPINNLYHRFTFYQKRKSEIEFHTLIEFAETVVSHATTSIQSYMANIHSMVSPSDPPIISSSMPNHKSMNDIHRRVTKDMVDNMEVMLSKSNGTSKLPKDMKKRKHELYLRPSVFHMLEEAIKNYETCSHTQTPQQLMFGLYTLIALTQARGFIMIKFSLDLLKHHNKGKFKIEHQLAEELYTHYSRGLMEIGKTVISRTDNSFRKCDPSTHKEGETFVMITELLQGYIENEVDLNPYATCGSTCSNYEHTKVEGCFLPDEQFCGKQRQCNGTMHNCRYLDSKATVCLSTLPYRRYDWVAFKNKMVLGNREENCRNEIQAHSWWRFFVHCSYCFCLCDDASSLTSDRYVSLRAAVSDVENGKVVTGVRFIKQQRILHIQIQQGKAMAQGQVDPDTREWVDVEPITAQDTKYKDGEDYITLTYQTRKIDLDTLKAPKDYVVTGLKFRMLGQHINLEMQVTPVDFITGTPKSNDRFWVSSDKSPEIAVDARQELSLYDPDDPRKLTAESEVDSKPNTYVTLQESSLINDVSQLTVPFFDAQPVAPQPMLWLEGVSLYHRGVKGSGGFIAFQTYDYNLAHYMEVTDAEYA